MRVKFEAAGGRESAMQVFDRASVRQRTEEGAEPAQIERRTRSLAETPMRAHLSVPLLVAACLAAGCNTAPIPPGKPVDIPTALEQVAEGLCVFKRDLAEKKQYQGIALDSITVELELTVDGAKNPPVAVAPDIQFMPTVSYGQTITTTKGSRLRLTLKNAGAPGALAISGCDTSRSTSQPANPASSTRPPAQ